MGYCITQRNCKFRISQRNLVDALAAAKTLVPQVDKLGHGGSWSGGKREEVWYSWIDMKIFADAQTLVDVLKEWRYDPELDAEGNIVSVCFSGEKIGQEELLFKAIAPYVKKGSFIEMEGEDGAMWRWVFDGVTCKEITPNISWDQ